MLVDYFSPLAPVVVLLLSAFILSIIIPRLPARWQAHRAIRYFSAPGLVGLAGLFLLGVRFTFGKDAAGEGLELLSGWYFSPAEAGPALRIRADELSLVFLASMLLFLLVVMLTALPLTSSGKQGRVLLLGASTCFLFISANRLTMGYALLVFDILIAFYWLNRKHNDLGVARLFLGVLTTSALLLTAEVMPGADIVAGRFILGLALWLRLGLYPFVEAAVEEWRMEGAASQQNNHDALPYWGLSLTVGIYLVIRALAGPWPEIIHWLAVITMLLNGLLVWLVGPGAETRPPVTDQRSSLLIRLILVQALLPLLLTAPSLKDIVPAYTVGLILSLAALWVTPPLGKPRFTERAWSWPYLPAIAASFTLIGLPFSLGWPVWTVIFQTPFWAENVTIKVMVILAEVLVLSGLVRYWLVLWRGDEGTPPKAPTQARGISLAVGIVALVPFLIPGLAPLMLSAIAEIELPPVDFAQSTPVLVTIAIIVMGAVGLGYFRKQIIERLKIPSPALTELIRLRWLLLWGEKSLSWAGKLTLRVNVILEGQHYVGWVLFTALVGALIIILRR